MTASNAAVVARQTGRLRPRERALLHGACALGDAELLALVLRTGARGTDAVALGQKLLADFGSLANLLQAPAERLACTSGLGDAKIATFLAVAELSRRARRQRNAERQCFSSSETTAKFVRAELEQHPAEVFAALFLDTRHRLIRFEKLFFGTIDAAPVYPREVARRALTLNAAAVIVAHNHPSGVAEPSQADQQITWRLRDALALIDVRLLDHFIVGDGAPVSLAERGVL
jgi:DNA repair protein RadC